MPTTDTGSPALLRGLELFALSSLAIAQPITALLAQDSTFFIAHHAYREDILILLVALFAGPPTVLLLVETLGNALGGRAGRATRWIINLLLATVIVRLALKELPIDSESFRLGFAVVLGLGFAALYERRVELRFLFRALAVAPLLFIFFFISSEDMSPILREADTQHLSSADVSGDIPVVMVIFDQLGLVALLDEHEQIDRRRYPNFARLVDRSIWFRNATTVAVWTRRSIPVILTGRVPDQEVKPDRARSKLRKQASLFSLLSDSYDLNIFENTSRLAPNEAQKDNIPALADRVRLLLDDVSIILGHLALPEFLAESLPAIDDKLVDFAGTAVPPRSSSNEASAGLTHRSARFHRFVDSIDPCPTRCFHFLHSLLPHSPWNHLATGEPYLPRTSMGIIKKPRTWERDPWFAQQGQQRYLLQVGYTDRLLGELMTRLEEVGLFDRALILVTSDHGVAFWPGRRLRRPARDERLPAVMRIPLIAKLPHQKAGHIVDRNVQTPDILPLIADVLSLKLPFEVDGCSPLDERCPEMEEKLLFGQRGIQQPQRLPKSMVGNRAALNQKFALYDPRDPGNPRLRVGPRPELIDLPLSRLTIGDDSALTIRLTSDALPLPAGFAPAGVSGIVKGAPTSGPEPVIAISMEDRIVAVVPALRNARGGLRFLAVVPEARAPHAQTLSFFAVSGRSTTLELAPVAVE